MPEPTPNPLKNVSVHTFAVYLTVLSVGAFWYLLPVNGQENPLVENTVSGSTVTIIIMRFKPCAPRIV
jgi:hypothetical protein